MSLVKDALQHMYFTIPHRQEEIEHYCQEHNIPLKKQPQNDFNPDDVFGGE